LANTDASSTSRYCNCYIRDIYLIISARNFNPYLRANTDSNTDSYSNTNTNVNSRSVI
jgi:hypothetical protein